ncbi:MCM2/3/5 family-domain-containing protein [Gymnopilus junonius]|uniref:DNA helicase n=1 Tax=Gymnopilus junonius TaxID=109634 RepID=A0A9P5TGD5_GYMJU|nr:MCM2/3/5 family-domain-containing protein [Gymnopilus junonius]
MSTPKRMPLFIGRSSSPMAFPSSSPVKTPSQRHITLASDCPMDSDPLDFPSTPCASGKSTPKNYISHLDIPGSSAPHLSAQAPPSDEPDEIRTIWGTTVNLAETMKLFHDFFRGFKPKYRVNYDRDLGLETCIFVSPEEGGVLTGETNLNLDVTNLLVYPSSKKLHVLKDMMLEVAEMDQQADLEGMQGTEGDEEINEILGRIYRVRPFGLTAINMQTLNPSDTDKLVCIKGLIIHTMPIIPDMKVTFFHCLTCSHTIQVEIGQGKIEEPHQCPCDVCASVGTMQVICLQETPDAVPDSQTPHTVSLSIYDELVGVSKPGDHILITGFCRSMPIHSNPRQRTLKSLFKTYLDVVHIKLGTNDSLGFDKSTRPAGSDRVPGVGGLGNGGDDEEETDGRQIQRPDIYDYLMHSLAPSIWEMDNIKKGIPRYRGDINVLLFGDPGVIHKITPPGVYASGKGSSAVGLTAYVTCNPESKQLVLESGAHVLSDGGVCCIDEFDKMSDATQSVLHGVMEQQIVSIAKAGIITTLNAQTSILTAANPVGSKYDMNLPITRNIDLPLTLILRFNLLYLVLDQVDGTLDCRLAQHLVRLYLEDEPMADAQNFLPLHELSACIDYARSLQNPPCTELVQAYIEMRNMGEDPCSSEKWIMAMMHQLESLIHLLEAHAHMWFSEFVELSNVKESSCLMHEAIKMITMDPHSWQDRYGEDMCKEILNGRGLKWVDLLKQLDKQSSVKVDVVEFTEVIKDLENEGMIKVVSDWDKHQEN